MVDEQQKDAANTGLWASHPPRKECGIGFVCSVKGTRSSRVMSDARMMLERMAHRGACDDENDSEDGAGVLTAIPDELYRKFAKEQDGSDLPPFGQYATGILFLEQESYKQAKEAFQDLARACGLRVVAWRKLGTNRECIGEEARKTEPLIRQVFVSADYAETDPAKFERSVYLLRKQAVSSMTKKKVQCYVCSLSTSTIVYKGQFNTHQLFKYYEDLTNPEYQTHLALVQSQFYRDTVPSWNRAQPNRILAHCGEIHTIRGNINLMKAREGVMKSKHYREDLQKMFPIVEEGLTDSGSLDNVMEFLVYAGERSLPEAAMTMVPETWENDDAISSEKKHFYRWAAMSMEPWDGPALLAFSDGRYIGAILDRNGLRPARYYLTDDDHLYLSSEVGVNDIPIEKIVTMDSLRPGRMLLVDTYLKKIEWNEHVKSRIARLRPHKQLASSRIYLDLIRKDAEDTCGVITNEQLTNYYLFETNKELIKRKHARFSSDHRLALYAYKYNTFLGLEIINEEEVDSMGNDVALEFNFFDSALLFHHFKQLSVEVNSQTHPFKEKAVVSLCCPIGPESNMLEPDVELASRLILDQPVLSMVDMESIKRTMYHGWKSKVIDMTFPVNDGVTGLVPGLDAMCCSACTAALDGYQMLVLSDRNASAERIPIPSLLAVGAIHQCLIRHRLRTKVAIVVETGEARVVHDFCVLLGFGADAICPYMVYETMHRLSNLGLLEKELNNDEFYHGYSQLIGRGIVKVMRRIEISMLQAYKHAQIFEISGFAKEVLDKCFQNTTSHVGQKTFETLASEALKRHKAAFPKRDYPIVINSSDNNARDIPCTKGCTRCRAAKFVGKINRYLSKTDENINPQI